MNNKNSSAFPIPGQFQTPGLTKREYFAALAMQAIMSNPKPGMKSKHVSAGELITPEVVGIVALEYADTLLAQLELEEQSE